MLVGCWSHVWIKFDEAVKSLPKGKSKGSSASQGLAYCNLLFEIEQGLSEETAEKRYEQQLEQAKAAGLTDSQAIQFLLPWNAVKYVK